MLVPSILDMTYQMHTALNGISTAVAQELDPEWNIKVCTASMMGLHGAE